jgi:hypothetical protein
MKTLLFCTSYSNDMDRWNGLFGRWINAVENTNLEIDQILLIDDGSSILPNWEGVEIVNEGELPDQVPESRGVIYHFNKNLGHNPPMKSDDPPIDSPGWHRSFMFAAEWAEKYGFEKILHIESDAFLISERIQQYVNDLSSGWTTFWCPRHKFPENNIQIIAGSSVQDFIDWKNKKEDYDTVYKGRFPEFYVPYTNIVKDFYGDRWGEFAPGMARVADPRCPPGVPRDADFVCQVFEESPCWWLEQ